MLKQYVGLILLCAFSFVFAQNKSFVYEMKFKSDPTKDSVSKAKYVLDINDGKSMFRTVRDKQADSTFYVTKRLSFMTTSFIDYKSVAKDLKIKETKKFINNFQKLFTIKIEEAFVWKIESEIKETLGMKSQKAVTIYGGRKWVAWFTNEIPLQEGPYVFQGLPGLITEIYDTQNDYAFTLVQIKNSDGKLYEKGKALPISWKQYEKLALDYYADPTREINGKNAGSTVMITKWQDENGNEFTPNFKEMNEREQKNIRENNNPIELNHKIQYR